MRTRLFAALAICVVLSGCGKSKNSVAPDPNAGFYGEWNGTLNMVMPNGPTQDGITVSITKNSCAFYMSGAQYPVSGYNLSGQNVSLNVDAFGFVLALAGTRSGGTMQGSATVAAVNGSGQWATTKAGAALPATPAALRLADVLRPH